jgi:pectate lyase
MINSGGIKIGLAKDGGTGTYRTTALTANATYMVVVKYDFSTSPNTASFWILTAYQSTEAGAGAADVTINTGTDLAPGAAGLGQCYLSDAAGGTFQVDELRIGSTWADAVGAAVGPATKLAFTTQPANAAPGATMSAVVVQIQDASGNSVSSNNVPVTLTLTGGSGTLSGTLTQNSDATGKATFSNLSIDTAGSGKQLTATASGIGAGLTGAVSATFAIVVPSPASKLAFTTQPADALVNATMSSVVVQIQDANSVAIASNNVPVTLTLSSGSGILSGTTTVNSDATGKATFSTLAIDTAGTGKQFTAAASGIGAGLAGASSSSFQITNATVVVSTNGVPVITRTFVAPGGFVLLGTNAVPNTLGQVLGSPSLSLPLSSWVLCAAQNFDANGNYAWTNPISPALPMAFYRMNVGSTVTKLTPPSITLSPVSQTVSPGATATFTVSATGPLLQYLWFFNGSAIGGATNTSLVIANAQAANVGSYFAIVANPAGAGTSATATLNVGNVGPSITSQPQDATVVTGGNATFTVVANGTAPLHYQWYANTNTLLGGATNAQLFLSGVSTGDAGKYRVLVSNNYGSAGSTNATLTVEAAPAAPSETNLLGYAALAGVTGGAGGLTVSVGDYTSLSNYLRHTEPLIIQITNAITALENYTYVYGNNKTILGVGTNAAFVGGDLRLNAINIIVANIFFQVTPGGTNDGITIDGGSKGTGKNIWIDHCTIFNAQDGSIDITKGADNVTLSWCKFLYAAKTPNFTHELVNLIGSSDTDFVNSNPFHVTIHHCWYADNAIERMPSVRHGLVHVFNCYYTCAGNNYCVRTRIGSQVLVENNYFQGVQNPWELLTTSGTTGLLKATGNNVTGPGDTSNGVTWLAGWYPGQSLIPGTDTLSDLNPPPYAYTPEAAANVLTDVPTFAGSGKYPYVQ